MKRVLVTIHRDIVKRPLNLFSKKTLSIVFLVRSASNFCKRIPPKVGLKRVLLRPILLIVVVRVRTKLGRVCRTDKLFREKIETVPSKRRQFERNFFIPCPRAEAVKRKMDVFIQYNVTVCLEVSSVPLILQTCAEVSRNLSPIPLHHHVYIQSNVLLQ